MKLDPDRLRTLSAVLRTGSFDAAASELSITQSAVSQRIKLLEETIGARLVQREVPCIGTTTGIRLAAHADQVEALEKILARELGHTFGEGPIPISIGVSTDSVATWFCDSLLDHKDFLFDFRIDHAAYNDQMLQSGEVVGVLTNTETPIPGCDSHALGFMVYVPVITPAMYDSYFAEGVTPEALRKAPLLRHDSKDKVWLRWTRKYFDAEITPPYHFIGEKRGYAKALNSGLGWGMEHIDLVKDDLAAGRLRLLTPDQDIRIALFWQTSRIWRDTLAELTHSICQTARTNLPQS